ncbi:hypothetical protein [Nonomuraea sp. LPB2021202275-12-8]|uniref:hypothetical protein n=1 Tax=Nonomuraea sp. LPB2021202275-12-8 TaxID=3120159 RepID=UPI00300CBC9A
MLKRRFAVLGAVAVLTLTGLGGSALADGTPPRTPGKVTCSTTGGKPAALKIKDIKEGEAVRVHPGLPDDGRVPTFDKGGTTVKLEAEETGKVALPVEAVPALPVPEGEPPAVRSKDRNGEIVDGPKRVKGLKGLKAPKKLKALKGKGVFCVVKK